MKSPQISGRKGMQRFLAGAVIGAITAWLLYFYMHGTMQEKQILTIREQQKTIENLKRDIEIWKKEAESLNQETEEQITVHEIQVTISNFRDFKLDLLSVLEAQEEIRKDLSSLLTKDLETVYKGKLLIRKKCFLNGGNKLRNFGKAPASDCTAGKSSAFGFNDFPTVFAELFKISLCCRIFEHSCEHCRSNYLFAGSGEHGC